MFRLLLCIAIPTLLFSCSSKDESGDSEDTGGFYALKVGNTYEYKYYRREGQTAVFNELEAKDEVVITGKELIGGETYFVITTTTTGNTTTLGGGSIPANGVEIMKVRDSLGYLINEEGTILFSNENTEDYLISDNAWGDIYGKLDAESQNITVPAGTFTASSNEIFAILEGSGNLSEGRDIKLQVEGIGEVFKTCSGVSTPEHFMERRLISHNVN